MMKIKLGILYFFLGLMVYGQETLEPKQRTLIDPSLSGKAVVLYLLVGQSNMAGNSPVEAQDTLPNPQIIRLNKNNRWEIAKEPLRVDKPIIGMGPGLAFAREMAKRDTTTVIGLIPAAVGGTSIDLWMPGAYDPKTKLNPYDQALERARVAMQSGTLKGIIWHQGESDSHSGKSVGYEDKLRRVVEQFRKDLGDEKLPFVSGLLFKYEVVKKVEGKPSVNQDAKAINNAILDLQKLLGHYKVVALKKAKDKGDGTHLDSRSAREMGKKYAEAMAQLIKEVVPKKLK